MAISMCHCSDTSRGQVARQQSKSSRKVINRQVSNGQQQRSRQTIKLDTFREEGDSVPEERGGIEERILTAQQTLGPGASNRQIARLVNCSPTTVARWLSQHENTQQEQEPA
jgi:DNA invertase Pin-like site-specific DNA recombinase